MQKLKCNVAEYGVIVNSRGEFLILKLAASRKFPKEAWMLPGGKITNLIAKNGFERYH